MTEQSGTRGPDDRAGDRPDEAAGPRDDTREQAADEGAPGGSAASRQTEDAGDTSQAEG